MSNYPNTVGQVLSSTPVTFTAGSTNKQTVRIPSIGEDPTGQLYSICVKTAANGVELTAYVRSSVNGTMLPLADFKVPAYAAGSATAVDNFGQIKNVEGLFAAGEDAEVVFIPSSAPSGNFTATVSVYRI